MRLTASFLAALAPAVTLRAPQILAMQIAASQGHGRAASVAQYMCPPFTLAPDMSLYEAMSLLSEKGISGAPVVELPSGRLVGVLSQFDVLRKAAGTNALDISSPSYNQDIARFLDGDVASAMTYASQGSISALRVFLRPYVWLPLTKASHCPRREDPVTVEAGTPIASIAGTMIEKRFNHVPVIERGAVVGVLRSTAVMQHILDQNSKAKCG